MAFVTTRLAEDERDALRVRDGAREWWCGGYEETGAVNVRTDRVVLVEPYDEDGSAALQHVARHDPARVLRDVEAARLLLSLHPSWSDRPGCMACDTLYEDCDARRALALPFSTHPDYRTEWKP